MDTHAQHQEHRAHTYGTHTHTHTHTRVRCFGLVVRNYAACNSVRCFYVNSACTHFTRRISHATHMLIFVCVHFSFFAFCCTPRVQPPQLSHHVAAAALGRTHRRSSRHRCAFHRRSSRHRCATNLLAHEHGAGGRGSHASRPCDGRCRTCCRGGPYRESA